MSLEGESLVPNISTEWIVHIKLNVQSQKGAYLGALAEQPEPERRPRTPRETPQQPSSSWESASATGQPGGVPSRTVDCSRKQCIYAPNGKGRIEPWPMKMEKLYLWGHKGLALRERGEVRNIEE